MFTSIFKPNLQAYPRRFRTRLDFTTPRGLFSSDDGNIYLVCDDPEWRFAIVLLHKSLPLYSHFKLGEQPYEHGIAHGLGDIRLIERDNSTSTFHRLGTLKVTENSLEMYVRGARGEENWMVAVCGRSDNHLGDYKTWRLVGATGHIHIDGFSFDDVVDEDEDDDEDEESTGCG